MKNLNSFFVVPGYTFFYWGFTLPKREYPDFINYFVFKKDSLNKNIQLLIGAKKYPAKIRLVRIKTKRFPNREVVQVFYDTEYDTLKALRKTFIYSYASTIRKKKPRLKEILEFVHVEKNVFKIKPIARQETDFDDMLKFMEDKNLFEYWKDAGNNKEERIFIDYSREWIPMKSLDKYKNRANVVYILHNKNSKQLYVGKANKFGDRVKRGGGRIGLNADWDKFMFFEINPKYAYLIEQVETYTIRVFASIMKNDVKIKPIMDDVERLVNRQLKKK